MTRDELRALADALVTCKPYWDSESVYQAAEFLRAIADAQPVAWKRGERGEWNSILSWRPPEPEGLCKPDGFCALYTLPLED